MTNNLNQNASQVQPPEGLIAVSKVFARAKKTMSLNEIKMLYYALSQVRFKEDPPEDNLIILDKKVLASVLRLNSDINHLSQDLLDEIRNLNEHSLIKIDKGDLDFYADGHVVNNVKSHRNIFTIELSSQFISLFAPLAKDYITLWSTDIFGMHSIRSVLMYEHLRLLTRSSGENEAVLYVKTIKELFGIPKDGTGSYMKKGGNFDRYNFEKFVLNPVCEDLKACKMLTLITQDNSDYTRVKTGAYVTGYRIRWCYSSHPAVATATEAMEITKASGQVLKVAKDLLTASQKPKSTKKGSFNDYNQRTHSDEWHKEFEKKKLGIS